jgi:lysophospholipase L1-like esterase
MKLWKRTRTKIAAALATVIATVGGSAFTLAMLMDGDDGTGNRADYLALGDSYSAGNGTTHQTDPCRRSTNAYPALYATTQTRTHFVHAACTGHDTFDVRRTQIDHITPHTRLITITTGGNDGHGFASVVATCALSPVRDRVLCDETLAVATDFTTRHLPGRLASTYAAIRAKAPHAHVIALGYPIPYNGTTTCRHSPAPATQQKINTYAHTLNQVIQNAATTSGVTWAPVDFTGHEICTPDPWLHGPHKDLYSAFHPNDNGHALGYLPALVKALGP